MTAPALPRRVRGLLLAAGGAALVTGVWTGLMKAGVHDPVGPVGAHGPLMVLGFLGTLIGLERAVAHGTRWSAIAPAASAAGVVAVLAGAPAGVAGGLFALAGLTVCAVFVDLLRRHLAPYLVLMAAGAVAWAASATLWATGNSPVRVAPLLAAFLVLTIVGERVELSRLRTPTAASLRRLGVAAGVFTAGTVVALVAWRTGLVLAGVGAVLQAAWLLRHDVARATVRRPGLPRFAATCMLAGHAWLAVGGALWVAEATGTGSWLVHDAALHSVFLGFVMSMVMGHAPIILPAVLGIALPHRPSAWVPLVLLHASLVLRVGADLAGSTWLRGWAAHGNVTALLLFVGLAAATAVRSRPGRTAPSSTRPLAASGKLA